MKALRYCQMTDITFSEWLYIALDKNNWKQADLSRVANIDSGFLSKVLSGERNPGNTFLTRAAEALGYPPEFVFRMAGILPPAREGDPTEEELLYLYDRLPEDRKHEIRDLIRYYVEKNEGEEEE